MSTGDPSSIRYQIVEVMIENLAKIIVIRLEGLLWNAFCFFLFFIVVL